MTRTYRYEEITPRFPITESSTPEDVKAAYSLHSSDLAETIAPFDSVAVYRVNITGEAEHADAVYLPQTGRVGIAWGAPASWADSTGDIEADINTWLNAPDAWEARN